MNLKLKILSYKIIILLTSIIISHNHQNGIKKKDDLINISLYKNLINLN